MPQKRPLPLQRRCPPQAVALLSALGYTLTGRDDGPKIARQLGEALADSCPAPADDALASLESALNTALTEMDLGTAQLRSGSDALEIDVNDYPAIDETPRHAEAVVFGLLEGLLTAYLNRLSGSDHLAARLREPPTSTSVALHFVYGKHSA